MSGDNNVFPPIVSASWLEDNLGDVVVCDTRAYLDEREGRDAYRAGHIPGARFLDLETEISDLSAGVAELGRHPLPSPEDFADALGRAGIGSETAVIAYDDAGGMIAGRLVFMLRVLGQRAAVLDGGVASWTGPLSTTAPVVEPVEVGPRPWPEGVFVGADVVEAHIAAGGIVVDSRNALRYRGEHEPIDPKAGHIPGAINLPFAENLADGSFKDVAELAERFESAGVDSDAIFYCGSGVSACNNLLAAEAAGFGSARLYVGSWSGWSSSGRPVETS